MEATHGFFESRRRPAIKHLHGGKVKAWAEYVNLSNVIGTLISKRLATLHELDTVYGVRDAYDLLEVSAVDGYNEALANQE